jgi:hypothetical protein
MIALLAPVGLAALAALALPLLIHLLRKPEDRVVLFAAWRYLAEPARPRERLQLRHWLLLALRLLLIATLALLLSQAIWRSHDQPATATTALWPGVESAAVLATPDHPVHQLTNKAPASQLRQLDSELPPGASLTVIVPETIAGLDAERLRLSRDVQWKIVPGGAASALDAKPLQISIRSNVADNAETATVQALLQAWQSQGRAIEIDKAAQDVALKPDTGLLFWLGGKPTPAIERWIAQGGRALLSQQSDVIAADAPWSVETQGRGRSVRVTTAFDATQVAALREPQIPAQLAALLLPEPIVDRAAAASVAPLLGADSGKAPGSPLDSILVLIAALLFVAERSWAVRLQRP